MLSPSPFPLQQSRKALESKGHQTCNDQRAGKAFHPFGHIAAGQPFPNVGENDDRQRDSQHGRHAVEQSVEVDFMLLRQPFFRLRGLFGLPLRHFGAAHKHAVADDQRGDEVKNPAHKGQTGKTALFFPSAAEFHLFL